MRRQEKPRSFGRWRTAEGFDLVVLRSGRYGSQLALRLGSTPDGRLRVRKWLRQSERWSDLLEVSPEMLLREASEADLERYRPYLVPLLRAAAPEVRTGVARGGGALERRHPIAYDSRPRRAKG